MKRIFILIIILLVPILIIANEIHNYEFELVGKIKTGNQDGQLGYKNEPPHTPMSFYYANTEEFYVQDNNNSRILIYDKNFHYIRKFNIKEKIEGRYYYAKNFTVDANNSISLYNISAGLIKINNQGDILFIKESIELGRYLNSNAEFYPFFDTLIYYYDNKIHCIDNTGNIHDDAKSFLLTNKYCKEFNLINSDLLSVELRKTIQNYLNENDILYTDRMIFIKDIYTFLQYRDFILSHNKDKIFKDKIELNINDSIFEISKPIGFDKYGNSYWYGEYKSQRLVIILSQFGEALDCFSHNLGGKIIVTPEGDIYFMETNSSVDYIFFYRLPIPLFKHVALLSNKPIVTSLTATSYNTYKNMYHPIKAFDGDIKTAWLEAAKGPGIGESITLELDREITVDSIQVLPGLFDAKWWKSNNRVKALTMKTGDSTTTLQFQDEMKPHKADFKEPKTFKRVEFIIKEVYPSGKDDDTAITDIQFYYKGERVQLDFGKQEAELKKPK